jgi:O-antigen ligase
MKSSTTLAKNGSTLREASVTVAASAKPDAQTWKDSPVARNHGMKLAFFGLLLFVFTYCVRPNDWSGFPRFPFARIAAVIAMAGLIPALFFQSGGLKKISQEMRYLVLLFLHLVICIPFSMWSGGSFEQILNEFSKVVLIALCVAVAVNSLRRLRQLLFVQACAVGVMVLLALLGFGKTVSDRTGAVRQAGVVGGIFENPNDFAFAIAIIFPLAVWFWVSSRSLLGKLFWAVNAISMIYMVFLTLSRGGLLAIAMSAVLCVWELGYKSKRNSLIVLVVVAALVLVMVAPGRLATRVQSMFDLAKDETGSGWARRALLIKGIETALSRPLFGVGPGNFPIFSGDWHGTHNTYVQFASEAGIPAILLFCIILWKSFANIRRIQTMVKARSESGQLAGALKACLIGYAVGALFGDTAYHFFPYLLFAYVSAFHQIVSYSMPEAIVNEAPTTGAFAPFVRRRPD